MNNVTTLPVVQPLARLAGDINRQHAEVGRHAKGMLLAAKAAGEMLIQAKGMVKHGEFQSWVKENCACSYRLARYYMDVAEKCNTLHFSSDDLVGISLREFLGMSSKPKTSPNATLTARQVQKVKKLYALATSTVNEEEADTAQRHLEGYANSLGMSADKAVRKAYWDNRISSINFRNPDEREWATKLVRQVPSKTHLVLMMGRLIEAGKITDSDINKVMEEVIYGGS